MPIQALTIAYTLIVVRHASDHGLLAAEVAQDLTESQCENQAAALNALEYNRATTAKAPRLSFLCMWDD